jgi:CRP-like cAMP-binding protein
MEGYKNKIYFLEQISHLIELSEEAKMFVESKMIRKSFSKGEVFIKSGEVCKEFFFLTNGLVRAYFDHDNKHITTWVCAENSLVTSVQGFFSQSPALENIQCLEHCDFECFNYEDLNYAIATFPEINIAYRRTIEEYYSNSEIRSYLARIPNAKDRYEFFIKITPPSLFDRIPKKYLASMLNMRPETLTRIS